MDDPEFSTYTLRAEGVFPWSVTWDTEEWNGHHVIYARAVSGEYTAVDSIDVVVDNPEENGGGGGDGGGDEGPPTVNLGSVRIGLYALIGFFAMIALIILAVVGIIILRRRREYRELLAEREREQLFR